MFLDNLDRYKRNISKCTSLSVECTNILLPPSIWWFLFDISMSLHDDKLHRSQTSLRHGMAALACSIAGRPCVCRRTVCAANSINAARRLWLLGFKCLSFKGFCFLPSQWNAGAAAGAAAGDGGAQAFVHPHPQVDSFSSSHFLCTQQDWCQLGDNCELWPCSSLHFWFVWKAFSWLIPWVSSVGEASWCICQDSRRWAYRDFHCKSSVPDPWVLWIGDLACKTAVQAMQKMFDPQMQMLLEKRLGANLTIPQRLKYYCTSLWEEMVLHISGLHMCHSFCWWSMLPGSRYVSWHREFVGLHKHREDRLLRALWFRGHGFLYAARWEWKKCDQVWLG